MKGSHVAEFNPRDLTWMGRLFTNPNLSHRKYKVKPLLPHSKMLKIIHLLFVLFNKMETGMFGLAIKSETSMAIWNPTNAPQAL